MDYPVFRYDLTILESHLDFFGHVHNSVYLEILEEARWDFITKNGFGFERMMQLQQGPVILDLHLKFIREIKLRQKISIFSQLTWHRTKLGELLHWITDEKGDRLLEAELVIGFFDLQTRRLTNAPADWLTAIGAGATLAVKEPASPEQS